MKWVDGLLGLLAFAAVGTWLATPGYVFLLDYVTGPTTAPIHIDATGLVSGMPVQLLVLLLALMVPAVAITKILILFTLLIAGISSAHLAYKISHSQIIALACGMFFMFNPFVFNRIFMGHIYVLFGYALMPLLLMLILRYTEMPSLKKAIAVGAMIVLIIITSIHYIVLLPIGVLFFALQYRKNISNRVSVSHIATMLMPSLAICASILISAGHNPEWAGHTLQDIPAALFSLRPYCSSSLLWDTLTLSANWRTATLTTYPCMLTPLVGIASGILLVAATAGASSFWIATLYVLSIGLAISASYIPGWNPMRDSGKFLGLTALAQILLIASAYAAIRLSILKKAFIPITLACTTIISLTTIIALQKSIIPAQYPASWHEWNKEFAKDEVRPTVLFLPWHQYMPLNFTNHVSVANPAPIFFSNANIISGDNIEIMRGSVSVPSISQNPVSQKIEAILTATSDNEFESLLANLIQDEKITHIMLAEQKNNGTLTEKISKLPTLTLASTSDDLAVWEVVSIAKQ